MVLSERLLKERDRPRTNMVNCQLRPNGIKEPRLIQVFEAIPREVFVSPVMQSFAYTDANLLLTPNVPVKRWLLAPQILGKLLQLANIQPIDKVLIVGCGAGYSIALVAQLAAHVVGVESDESLAYIARTYAAEQEIFNIQVVSGALSVGYPKGAPYDVILIEGAVEKIPLILMQQLSPHQGRLVTVFKKKLTAGQVGFGKGVLITRTEDKISQVEHFDGNCQYLPEFEDKRRFYL